MVMDHFMERIMYLLNQLIYYIAFIYHMIVNMHELL